MSSVKSMAVDHFHAYGELLTELEENTERRGHGESHRSFARKHEMR
jgi:hypothetical protein